MLTQNMTQAHILVPTDNLSLITDLVLKLGGHVVNHSTPDGAQAPMPELERGGKMLKGLRQRAGFTQAEIAKALGIPQSHISEFERDKRSIPFKHARKLAELLQTIPSHFMQPNAETRAAMTELEAGNGHRCASAEELFQHLEI